MRSALFVAAVIGWGIAAPASAQEWVRCASEGEQCRFSGLKMVRYGASDQFRFGSFTDSVACSNATFGNPMPGTPKTCWTYQTTGEADEERAAEELRRWTRHLNAEIQSRDERISGLEAQVGQLQAEAQGRYEHISGLEAQVGQLQGTLQRRDKLVDALQAEVQSRAERIRRLEAQVEQMRDPPPWRRVR